MLPARLRCTHERPDEDMNEVGKRFICISAYALGMALLEAIVVIYLRALLLVSSEQVSLGSHLRVEIYREMGTLVMLAAVGWLAGQDKLDRLAYALFAFGLWDIGYYAWLKVLIGWPATPLDWDILFLIPLRWWGPVLAPILMASLICVGAVLAVVRLERRERLGITSVRLVCLGLGCLLALYVFMADALHALLAGRSDWTTIWPGPFNWPLFCLALALMALPVLTATWPTAGRRSTIGGAKNPGLSRKSGC